jgi:hypothetical protein
MNFEILQLCDHVKLFSETTLVTEKVLDVWQVLL